MNSYVAEFLGTAILILFGNGVVANVLLEHSKGKHGGWMVIATGWAVAVFVGVYVAAPYSGAHLNPAVSIAMAVLGRFELSLLPGYILAQLLGAMTGALFNWAAYRRHFNATANADAQLAVFATMPAIPGTSDNLITEAIGAFILITGVLYISAPTASLGALDALPVALLVLGIGLSLGGPTGYAINPARDLGPRIMHQLLPIKGKGSSGWSYAWIPVAGPIVGALCAALFFQLLH